MRRAIKPVLLGRYNSLRNMLPEGIGAYGDPNSLTIPQLQRAIEQLEAMVGEPQSIRTRSDLNRESFNSILNQVQQNTPNLGDWMTPTTPPPTPQNLPSIETLLSLNQDEVKQPKAEEFKPPYSQTNLSPKQVWVQQQLRKSKEKLLGLEVRLVANAMGDPTNRLYEGFIVRISDTDPAIFSVDLSSGEVYDAYIFQLEPLKKVEPAALSPRELEEQVKENHRRIVQKLADRYSNNLNSSYQVMQSDLKYKQTNQKNLIAQLKKLKKDIATTERTLAASPAKNVSADELLILIDELNKHVKVKKAFLSEKEHIMIITEQIFAIDRKTDQEMLDKPMGQFVFRIVINTGSNQIDATNLTFAMVKDRAHSEIGTAYFHPNINQTRICWGNNQTDINQMLQQGQIYQAIDFAITFFSVFPHEEGANPWIDFEEWYECKELIDIKNTYIKRSYDFILEKPLVEGELVLSKKPKTIPVAPASAPIPVVPCGECGSTNHSSNEHFDLDWEDEDDDDE